MTAASRVLHAAPKAPSAGELVQRARAFVPVLRERADEVEKSRHVSRETIQAFKDAGFFKILQPPRWGGWGMDPRVFFDVLGELGRGCPSSAWNMMILGVHQWEFGIMSPQAGDDVWARDPVVLVASSYAPFGTLTEVEGGYRLTGLYRTSSGTDHGESAFLGAMKMTAQGVPVDRMNLLVPRTDYAIEDDWFVMGLAGTGSKSLRLESWCP